MELELLSNKKKRRTLRYVVLCAVFVVFLVSAFWMITSNNKEIRKKQAELNDINYQLDIQVLANQSMEAQAHYSDEEYMQNIIRKAHNDLDYVRQGEIVFVITAGN